MFAKAVRHI